MNCDQAFEHLTDATLCRSPALERHLSACPRCRQMQETLSPALAYLLGSDLSPAAEVAALDREFSSLDAATGEGAPFLSPEAVEVAERVARQLAAAAPAAPSRTRQWTGTLARCAALFFVGAATALGVFGRDAGAPAARDPAACTRHRTEHADLAASGLDAPSVVRTCVACHLATPEGSVRNPAAAKWDTLSINAGRG